SVPRLRSSLRESQASKTLTVVLAPVPCSIATHTFPGCGPPSGPSDSTPVPETRDSLREVGVRHPDRGLRVGAGREPGGIVEAGLLPPARLAVGDLPARVGEDLPSAAFGVNNLAVKMEPGALGGAARLEVRLLRSVVPRLDCDHVLPGLQKRLDIINPHQE